MASRPVTVQTGINGGHQFRDLVRTLRATGRGDLKKELNKDIREAAKPVVQDVKRAALALPDRSKARRKDGKSIRQEIANAVQLSIRQDGVRIIVNKKKLPADSVSMAHAFEKGSWRHPVHAKPTETRGQWTWVVQKGKTWFKPTVAASETRFRRAVLDTIDRVAKQINP